MKPALIGPRRRCRIMKTLLSIVLSAVVAISFRQIGNLLVCLIEKAFELIVVVAKLRYLLCLQSVGMLLGVDLRHGVGQTHLEVQNLLCEVKFFLDLILELILKKMSAGFIGDDVLDELLGG